jgi:proline iminopeptidase
MTLQRDPASTDPISTTGGNGGAPGPDRGRGAGRSRRHLGEDRRVAWALSCTTSAGYGLLAASWTPRGPLTTVEAFAAMALALVVGVVAGLVLRSRWAMLTAPAVFVLVFELLRLPVTGPTVDGIHLGSTYGIMALVVGRGIHTVLAVLPMVLGASVGAALARRTHPTPPSRPTGVAGVAGLWLRRAVAAATALALAVLTVAVARPASTDPIVDAQGRPVPGSVAELTEVDTGGHDLAVMIRGRSAANPVMLFLAGGPGGSELGAMRRHLPDLEDHFVVATLDQRGTGKSYPELGPTDTLTLDAAVADVIAVTQNLRERFDEQKVYLVGQSWGSTLGVLAAQQHPELFHAFVGVGQMVSQVATDKLFYADTLAWARARSDTDLVNTLEANGPPPYTDVLDYEPALSFEMEIHPYDHSANSEGAGQMGENLFVEEYTLLEQLHLMGATLDVFSALYPQLQEVDFRTQARALDVPVYLAQGAHEAPGRAVLAEEWFDLLQAPDKELVVFETSGHRPLWEQPAKFTDFMTDTVLARTRQP